MRTLRDLSAFTWFGSFVFFGFLAAPTLVTTLPKEIFREVAPILFGLTYKFNIFLPILIAALSISIKDKTAKLYASLSVVLILACINYFVTWPMTSDLRNYGDDPIKKELFFSAHNKDLALYICQFLLSLNVVLSIRKYFESNKQDPKVVVIQE